MKAYTVALFGEAEKGDFQRGYYCKSLLQLEEHLGNPPPESRGLDFAVQALLYQHHIIFFRVKEEGFSQQDYFSGLKLLERQTSIPNVAAIGIPGVGDEEIIQALTPLCLLYHSILLTTEADLFDYLTQYARS
jgi:hypothetical protein